MRPGPAARRGLAHAMKIKVIRALYLAGEVQPVDTVLDVDARLAAELVHNNKAQRVVEPPADEPPADEPPAAQTTPPSKGGKGKNK